MYMDIHKLNYSTRTKFATKQQTCITEGSAIGLAEGPAARVTYISILTSVC